MKKNAFPSMVVTYQRCNANHDVFHLQDWKSNHADVLWVASILDRLPSCLAVKFNQLSKKQVVFNPNGTAKYFLTQVPDDSKFEFKDITMSPFLPETGLQDLNCKLKLNWKRLTLKFEFPVVEDHLEGLKSRRVW
jgi:hypothetical protein